MKFLTEADLSNAHGTAAKARVAILWTLQLPLLLAWKIAEGAFALAAIALMFVGAMLWCVPWALLMVGACALITAPIALIFWGWHKDPWLGAFMTMTVIAVAIAWHRFVAPHVGRIVATLRLRRRPAMRRSRAAVGIE